MPRGIGRSAEEVLRGCIERSVANRWTVAMVDELAWGIGWGSAADDVTPPPEAAKPSRSVSRTKSRERTRSSSRTKSAIRSSSRSKSRHPYDYHHPLLATTSKMAHPEPTQPSFASLTHAILRTSSSTSSNDSSHDSALLLQPVSPAPSDASLPRGRAPRLRLQAESSLSRSRSPGEMPLTPKDLSIDAMRLRRKSPPARAALTSPDLDADHSSALSELDTLDEDARWVLSPDAGSESAARSSSGERSRSAGARWAARGRGVSRSRDELRHATRNGSMPPALLGGATWILPSMSMPSKTATPATPIPVPNARSRSLGRDNAREGRYAQFASVSAQLG